MKENTERLALTQAVRDLSTEVTSMRGEMEHLDATSISRAEYQQRRKFTLTYAVLAVIVAIQFHDEHFERCGPYTVDRKGADFKDSANNVFCDIAFPTHTHAAQYGDVWPTFGNVVGLVLYLAALVALAAAVRYRHSKEHDS